MWRHERKPPGLRRRLAARERKWNEVLPASLRIADVANGLPSILGLCLEKNARIGIVAPVMVQMTRRRQFKRANRHRLRKMDDAHVAVRLNSCGNADVLIRRASQRRRERNVTDIVPVAVRIAERWRNRNGRNALLRVRIGRRGRRPSRLDVPSCIHELPHGVRRRDPRAATHRPARTILHLERHAKPCALVCGMHHEIVPLCAQTRNLFGDAIPSLCLSVLAVEELDAAEARILERLQVCRQPRLGHIAANDMEPCFRATVHSCRHSRQRGSKDHRFNFHSDHRFTC